MRCRVIHREHTLNIVLQNMAVQLCKRTSFFHKISVIMAFDNGLNGEVYLRKRSQWLGVGGV